MSRTVRQCIVEALENLGKSQLRRFKEDLSEVDYRPGYTPIPRGRLEDADPQTLGRLLVSTYREGYAAELTVQVLEALPEREVADSLLRSLSRSGTGTAGGPAAAAAAGDTGTGAHPVERHHRAIVQRFHSAAGVLDQLLAAEVIGTEQYELVRAQPTRMEQNRVLLRLVGDKGPAAKDRLWRAIELEDGAFTRSLTEQ